MPETIRTPKGRKKDREARLPRDDGHCSTEHTQTPGDPTTVPRVKKVKTVSPAGYATLVAEDREQAATFDKLLSAGNRTDAGHHIAEAAEGILGYCKKMSNKVAQNMMYLQALDNIRKVAKRSGKRGDQVQLQWCGYLHQKLKGG